MVSLYNYNNVPKVLKVYFSPEITSEWINASRIGVMYSILITERTWWT